MKPDLDGITHINIYSKGKTELGKLLSNFSYSPIKTEDGWFASVEGYWYWLLSDHNDKECLRELWGFNAKAKGRELRSSNNSNEDWFKNKIKKAIEIKINNDKNLQDLLIRNNLPFDHYYVYETKIYNESIRAKWIIDWIDEISNNLKRERDV